MTPDELEYMAKCAHRSACERLVTLHAPLEDDSFWWCRCKTCPNYSVDLRPFNINMLEASVEYLRNENIGWEDMYRELAARFNKLSDLALYMYLQFADVVDWDGIENRMRELGVEV